jgi:glycosyltransferase involved in cell wall biosynthesis
MHLLKVTHVVLSLDVGGMERNVLNQIRQGQRLGQQVSILCIEQPGEMAARAEAMGARVVCVHKRPGVRPGIIIPIRAALRNLQPDVVHTHQIGPLFYTGLATRALRVPLLVHTEHGRMNYGGRWRTRMLGRMAAKFARVFYCLSRDMVEHVARNNVAPRKKLRVILNGIDTAIYRRRKDNPSAIRSTLGIPPGAPLIGTIGRLSEIKLQDVLIRAFAALRKQHAAAHLLLVGEGPMHKPLLSLANSLGIGAHVHFAGYQVDTTPYLHALDLFALPSRSEGMPQALLEACVAEVPVIATRVDGIPEVIEDGKTGLLVEPGDVAGLAEGMMRLLDLPDQARQMSSNAFNSVIRQFDISRMAAEYHADFTQLLGHVPSAELTRATAPAT